MIKTKLMRINSTITTPIRLNDTPIEQVTEFCYLGSEITKTEGTSEDITTRIHKARSPFGRLKQMEIEHNGQTNQNSYFQGTRSPRTTVWQQNMESLAQRHRQGGSY